MPQRHAAPNTPARALRRVLLFWVGYLALLFVAGMVKGMLPSSVGQLAWGTLGAGTVLLLTLAMLHREGRGTASIGLRLTGGSLPRLGAGFALGAALYALHLGLIGATTSLRLERNPEAGATAIVIAVLGYLALSAMEELGFRGYPLRTLVPVLGHWRAQLLVAAVFAANHLLYGWSLSSVLLGVTAGGLLFGAAATASGGLAVPIGIHAAWNTMGWMVGEKGNDGMWRLAVAPGDSAHVTAVATVTYLVVMLGATAVCWAAYRRRVGGPTP